MLTLLGERRSLEDAHRSLSALRSYGGMISGALTANRQAAKQLQDARTEVEALYCYQETAAQLRETSKVPEAADVTTVRYLEELLSAPGADGAPSFAAGHWEALISRQEAENAATRKELADVLTTLVTDVRDGSIARCRDAALKLDEEETARRIEVERSKLLEEEEQLEALTATLAQETATMNHWAGEVMAVEAEVADLRAEAAVRMEALEAEFRLAQGALAMDFEKQVDNLASERRLLERDVVALQERASAANRCFEHAEYRTHPLYERVQTLTAEKKKLEAQAAAYRRYQALSGSDAAMTAEAACATAEAMFERYDESGRPHDLPSLRALLLIPIVPPVSQEVLTNGSAEVIEAETRRVRQQCDPCWVALEGEGEARGWTYHRNSVATMAADPSASMSLQRHSSKLDLKQEEAPRPLPALSMRLIDGRDRVFTAAVPV